MSSILLEIKEKCAFVADNNAHVRVCYDEIANYVDDLSAADIMGLSAVWDTNWHYFADVEPTLSYMVALDCINFGSGYFSTLKKREGETSGYVTVAMALKDRYLQKPMTAEDFTKITAADCADIFAQDIEQADMLDLMGKFAEALQEMGAYIVQEYQGSFSAFIEAAGQSADKLVAQVACIPPFRDISHYHGQDIPIYKRAQILVGDLYTAFEGEGPGKFDDIGDLTIFADNVVPHVLRYDGLLSYTDALAERIDTGDYLQADEDAEIALRACSIHAAQKIIEEFRARGNQEIYAMHLDHWLWHRGHEAAYTGKKRHHTKTTDY